MKKMKKCKTRFKKMQQLIKTVRVERFCTKATEVRTSQKLQSEQVNNCNVGALTLAIAFSLKICGTSVQSHLPQTDPGS